MHTYRCTSTKRTRREPSGCGRQRQTQARYNARRAAEWLVYLVQANFDDNDIWITLTYPGEQPPSEDQARKDIKNYIKRINRWRAKRGMGKAKYVYVIEWEDDGGGQSASTIMSSCQVWIGRRLKKYGEMEGGTNAARLQPDDAGLEALARYITKGRATPSIARDGAQARG